MKAEVEIECSGLLSVLTAVFTLLKISNIISWPWIIIFVPIFISIVWFIIICKRYELITFSKKNIRKETKNEK